MEKIEEYGREQRGKGEVGKKQAIFHSGLQNPN